MQKIFLLLIALVFSGCIINGVPNMKDYADGWVGTDINEFKQVRKLGTGIKYVKQWWKDNNMSKDYFLINGNLVHVNPEREDCLIHWEVDKKTNKIIGYKFEGGRCY